MSIVPVIISKAGEDKFRGPAEVRDSIPRRFKFPSFMDLADYKETYNKLQTKISDSLVYHGISRGHLMPPCSRCHPGILYYCGETGVECNAFEEYSGGDIPRHERGDTNEDI